ncbi:MAG: DUF3696 domain-containing protein, partial [bacterium]|nr:DUF3696 domain-containing protein [bacterium]
EKSYAELGTFNDIIFGHNIDKSLDFEIDWKLEKPFEIFDPEQKKALLFKGTDLGFHSAIRQTQQGRVFAQDLSYTFDNFKFRMKKIKTDEYKYDISTESLNGEANKFQFKRGRGRGWELPSPIKFYGFPDQIKAYYQNAGFLSDLQLQLEDLFARRIYYLGPLREYPKRRYFWAGGEPTDMGRRGEQVIDAILVSRERGNKIPRGKGKKKLTVEEYVAYWLKKLGLIHGFHVNQMIEGGNLYEVKLKLSPQSPEVVITDVGFGVSQILPVITLCYYVPRGSILLIEQPEIHLHPKVQAGLADVFIDAIKTKGIQIILESHSEHLLRRLQRRIAEEEFDSQLASLYFCETGSGQSNLKKLNMNLFGQIRNWPEGFFGDEMAELAATSQAIFKRKNNG